MSLLGFSLDFSVIYREFSGFWQDLLGPGKTLTCRLYQDSRWVLAGSQHDFNVLLIRFWWDFLGFQRDFNMVSV